MYFKWRESCFYLPPSDYIPFTPKGAAKAVKGMDQGDGGRYKQYGKA
jgi:hypothetical protein